MTTGLPANPWTMLGIGALAVVVWIAILAAVWTLLYAHDEREATYVSVETEQ